MQEASALNSRKKSIDMNLQTRAFLYQLACFAVLFLAFRFMVDIFTSLRGVWVPLTAFVVGTILSPKFRVIKTPHGEKMFVSWLFMKGIKEIK